MGFEKRKSFFDKSVYLLWPRHHHNFPSKMVSEVSRKSQYKAELYQAINMLFNAVKFDFLTWQSDGNLRWPLE